MVIACTYRFDLHSSIYSPLHASVRYTAEDGEVVTSRDVVCTNQTHYLGKIGEYQAEVSTRPASSSARV